MQASEIDHSHDEDIDTLDCQMYRDSKTGHSLLFMFEAEGKLVIDHNDKDDNPIETFEVDLNAVAPEPTVAE